MAPGQMGSAKHCLALLEFFFVPRFFVLCHGFLSSFFLFLGFSVFFLFFSRVFPGFCSAC